MLPMRARLALAVSALLLSACASFNSVHSEVASFGSWPQGRAPGSYVIERLPSQQARGVLQEPVETAAHEALRRAGFRPADTPEAADVVVQLGSRITRYDVPAWDDPLWWRWGPGYWRHPAGYRGGPWGPWGPWGWPRTEPQFDREVALLIRDRRSNQPLYEARAATSGFSPGSPTLIAAMFQAALADFPNTVPTPHRVSVPLGGAAAPAAPR